MLTAIARKFCLMGLLSATFSQTCLAVQFAAAEIDNPHHARQITSAADGASATPGLGTTNYSDSWWKSDESGWGITITDHNTDLFVQWYTYDQSGHNQKYVIPGGTFTNGKCQFGGTLQHVTGPGWTLPAFDPTQVIRTAAGSASLDFCPSGLPSGTIVFNYTADGVTDSKQLTRLAFGNDIPRWGGNAGTGAVDFTDLWWNPDESGWGVSITQHGNNIFARIFVYEADGRPLLFVIPGVVFTSPTSFSGAVQVTAGPWFGTSPFDPAQVVRTSAGSATFTFSDANNGVLTYTVDGITKTKSITRIVFGDVAPSVLVTPAQKRADANRLLQQASFGPTDALVQHVLEVGIPGWLNEQFAAPATQYPAYPYVTPNAPASCVNNTTPPITATSYCLRDNYSLFQTQLQFFQNALGNPDQLRQRVAFALSQILVTSGVENARNYAMAGYQQMLLDKAFGNYEDILKAVTISPMMGDYLNMANNDKPDAAKGYHPNENYARELQQLFSIGLVKLNADGSPMLDPQGKTIPTYDQAEVTSVALVLTGWTYPAAPGTVQSPVNFNQSKTYTANLVPLANHHDSTAKTLLDGALVPAGLDIVTDLNNLVHLVFMHPNVGPFIGRQLIQKLVNGNPSPGYVSRVTAAFNDNGQGVRGDMKAVISAILLDPEARGAVTLDPAFGKLREPVLYMTTLARALNATSDGVYFAQQSGSIGQPLFYSPTVFNYYSSNYMVPGTAVLGPEFDLLDTSSAISRINLAYNMLFGTIAPSTAVYGATGTQFNWSPLQALAGNPSALADKLSDLLLNGTMSAPMKTAIVSAVSAVAASDTLARARTAVYLIAASPQFQVER